MNKSPILMIDDDEFFINSYTSLLDDEYIVFGAPDISTGFVLIGKVSPVVLLLDISLKTEKEGLTALPNLKKQFPHLPIIIVTNWDSHLIFKEACALGADDFFIKSDNINTLKIIIKKQLIKSQIHLDEEGATPITHSLAFRQVLKEAKKVAGSHCTVLITGETGVGKEVVATYIHKHSQRSKEPFVAINCGSIPETLLESELFGHEKGAFTDAVQQKKGKIEVANGGTLFLDEIDELPKQNQPALLRVLQNQEIERVGSTQRYPSTSALLQRPRVICES